MATELIPSGKNAATSADFTIDDGSVANVFLKTPADTGVDVDAVFVEIKGDDASYTQIGILGAKLKGVTIQGPGIFRVRRADGLRNSAGVSRA